MSYVSKCLIRHIRVSKCHRICVLSLDSQGVAKNPKHAQLKDKDRHFLHFYLGTIVSNHL